MTGIYVRVSTDEQALNGYSIRAQKEKLIAFCVAKDWNDYKIYCDEGVSGKSIEIRPGLLSLIKDIKSKIIDNVVVYKIDRLTRSTRDLIELVELFNNCDCSFNSFCESIDTKSSTGRLFIKIMGLFAEFERENIAERVKLGLERKVREGFSIANNNISYGYSKKNGQKIQSINENEAVIVKKVYKMFLNNHNCSEIARYLNNNNILTKKGNKWSYKTIKLILTNPNYIGKVRYGINKNNYFEAKGNHKPIIDFNEYNKVFFKIKYKHLYNDYLICACNEKMLGKKTESGVRYFCKCCGKSISENKINNIISKYCAWGGFSIDKKVLFLKNNISKIYIDKSINIHFISTK